MNLSLLDVIVTASVSSIFALIVYNWQKTGDFRRDYLKAILERRIIAYEKIATVVAILNIIDTTESGKTVLAVYIPESESEKKATRFYDLLVEFYDIWNHSLWINSFLLDLCKEAYMILNKDYIAVKQIFGTEECIAMGTKTYLELDVKLRAIQIQLVKDLQELNNIETYFASKGLSYIDNFNRAERRLKRHNAHKP